MCVHAHVLARTGVCTCGVRTSFLDGEHSQVFASIALVVVILSSIDSCVSDWLQSLSDQFPPTTFTT